MKNTLLVALTVGGFFGAVPLAAFADDVSAAPLHLPAAAGVEFRSWHQGESPLRLIRKDEGVCVLTGISGGFAGGGEAVRVYVGDDGYWYLGGRSMQEGVAAECVVVRFPVPAIAATPAPPKHVKILAASYSFGSHFADVTARVKVLLHGVGQFHADPDWLMVDPQPGWHKCLVIFCKIDGQSAIFSADEGETISPTAILEKARLVTAQDSIRTGARRAKKVAAASEESEAVAAQGAP